ncbi:MAG: bifunctional adenosylcobinamide kinase/adenosylcobinamide-phosphate guanylyltransferase [Chloroflexi bacterium]|nr:bifunctional adenosylcobinamide kinase/adenosylcobinamide-phosphate guanylyltransferase [Chloroflexota bacterium]
MGAIHLITGGVKSGKSRFALELANERAAGSPVRCIATARRDTGDDSLDRRIDKHVSERPATWTLFEPPTGVIEALNTAGSEAIAILDCVTLWIGDLLSEPEYDYERGIADRVSELIEVLQAAERPTLVITNEVGSGIAPPTVIGNDFADELGSANRLIADAADRVTLLVAGQPLRIK